MVENEKINIKNVCRIAGAFTSWVIGSGFATGQELLQFFSSYGLGGYGAIAICLAGFTLLGMIILTTGFDNRRRKDFNSYIYFSGGVIGRIYSAIMPVVLIMVMVVLISGAGATGAQYYGLNHYLGVAIMSALVLASYLIGFRRLINILSMTGPVIIAFMMITGLITIIAGRHDFQVIADSSALLESSRSTCNWALSGVTYCSLVFLGGSTYYTALGGGSARRKEAKAGALIGGLVVTLVIAIMSTAIMLQAGELAKVSIPNLYLARNISPVMGLLFSVILLTGIFSSCSATMWSICHRVAGEGTARNRVFAVCLIAAVFIMGLFPFGELLGIVYPIIGYTGIIFLICVLYRGFAEAGKRRPKREQNN